ncbi:MAG: FHA domain-containing protein [Labilithrix sp.]
MSVHLQILLGKERGRVIPLEGGTYVFGRGADADIVLPTELVSRTHARVVVNASDLIVSDLESSNGTFVNGARVLGEMRVAIGGILSVGDVVCRVYGASPQGLLPGAAPGMIAGNLTEIPPAAVLRAIAVLKKSGVLNLTSPPLEAKITFGRGQIAEVLVDTRKTRDPIQALTALLRWKGTFDFEPTAMETQPGALLGLDAVIAPVGSSARPSMIPKAPRPSRP